MKPLIIIPARGGSKGIPGKNIKPLQGRPLIHYTIDVARGIANDKDICLTTDSPEIKTVAEAIGLKVPFLRPEALAQDGSGSREVLLHALDHYQADGKDYDVVILLQPTSPFREIEHVKEAISLFTSDLDMVVSVKETGSNPYYVLFEENEEGLLKKSKEGAFVTRQECPKVWEYNGAIYIINAESLRRSPLQKFERIKKYVMDDVSSVDIDTPLDWMTAEFIMQNRSR